MYAEFGMTRAGRRTSPQAPAFIVPVVQARFEVVEKFEESARAAGGFGSTGR